MTPRQANLAADIFTGVVVASVGIALAGLTWRMLGDAGTMALSPAGAVAPAAPPVDVNPVIALAPFGRPGPAGGQAVATTLPLQLKGVLLAIPRTASTALIANGQEPARPYRVGEAVGGGTIAEIAVDHVVLAVGGRSELLAFPKANAPAPASSVTPSIVAPSPPPPPPPVVAAAPAPASTPQLGQIGQAVEGQGFKIGGDPPPALLSAGIQPGDVIERVNGIDVSDPARAREVIGSATLAGGARVDVLRNGRRFTVAISR